MPHPDVIETSASEPGELPRVLGPFAATAAVIGSVIGSGIFLKPSTIAQELDSFFPILTVWIVMGLATMCGALTLAELASMAPQAGGPYVYLREAYGKPTAFLWGWVEFWIIRTGSIGALATASIIYLKKLAPVGDTLGLGLAMGVVAGLTVINMAGALWGARVQTAATVIKLGFLASLIVFPFVLGKTSGSNLQPLMPSEVGASFWGGLGAAMIAVMWPYDGWINLTPITEEIRNPGKNVPLALIGGMAAVMTVYVLANVAYHATLPHAAIAASSGVASDLFDALFGDFGRKAVAVGVMCSTLGAVSANMLIGPRIYFAMARDRLLPAPLCRVHGRFGTPYLAILAQGLWAILLMGLVHFGSGTKGTPDSAKTFDALTDLVIFGGSIFYALAVGAVFVLRRKRPDLPRPYWTWGYPVTPSIYLLAFGAAMVSLLATKFRESILGSSLIAAGAIVYFAQSRRKPPGEEKRASSGEDFREWID